MKCKFPILFIVLILGAASCQLADADKYNKDEIINISGVYPSLAYYNDEGECGTGAVVPWADRLWVVTYGPHLPFGSSDKLYEITPELNQIIRAESIGGTPANRMIHRESNQLFIGPYAIDKDQNVRVIPYNEMPGRHTGNARHLFDPVNKIYYGTMEEGFYEVDVNTLQPTLLYEDRNVTSKKEKDESANIRSALLYGVHGKGLYSGQGVLVYSNNGESGQKALEQFDIESGSLSEWDGKEWKLVRRNQFVEITGPGGIYGNKTPETDPLWTTGWDHKSVLVGVRNHEKGWRFFRLPKASHSYDGAHGWNTEWPRIRNVGTEDAPDYLMTMHGMFWRFPPSFSYSDHAGIRPRSAYLKITGDYTRWRDQLVFGCDDFAKNEFLNKRKVKGDIGGAGQSNSNLWFTSLESPDHFGPTTAEGGVWLKDKVEKGEVSEPFLFSGWDTRSVWIQNGVSGEVVFSFEADKTGTDNWEFLTSVKVGPNSSARYEFSKDQIGEWVRVKVDKPTVATVHFTYNDAESRILSPDEDFKALATIDNTDKPGGFLYGLGDNRRKLGVLSGRYEDGEFMENGYYELDSNLNLVMREDSVTSRYIRDKLAIPKDVVSVEESSVLVVDDKGRRWRFPKRNEKFSQAIANNSQRICREVVTERDLMNLHGTFYELPAENADGFAKVRPIASHDFWIHDYASYRGLLILSGVDVKRNQSNDKHIIASKDGKMHLWAGVIDDLWKLGKPTGVGGPWKNSKVEANIPSDPYLIGFYDKKRLYLSHDADEDIAFNIEVNPVGDGPWMNYKTISVGPGEEIEYVFPTSFQARWIRFSVNYPCEATAFLKYE